MSPGDRYHIFVLWITLQLLFSLSHTVAMFNPYISEFEFSPEFHPSRNPSCPRRWSRGAWEDRRSPEEGSPVGQEPSIEIRAVLVRCPKSPEEMSRIPMSGNAYNITAGRSQDILEFHGFDIDEPAHHSEVRNCRRKLIVTMKFNNVGKTRTQEEFVVVDHVLDPVTMQKARLLNPFVFKVRQEQVLQLYGLKFQSVVNGEAKEEVINKKSSNYTGCDDSLSDPTCGQMMFDGKPVPYSQGFCCSCDPDVNAARQPPKTPTSLALASSKMMPTQKENPGGFRDPVSKRERSLKSSELEDNHEETDLNDRPGFKAAFSAQSPSRGKIEAYIDAVGKGDVLKNLRKPSGLRKEELSAELVNLEHEYETLKESRSMVEREERNSNPKCKDFRKLARNRSSNLEALEVTRDVKNSSDSSAVLRQESMAGKLHPEHVSEPETPTRVESKDQYADWVIKYAKLNDNHLANSQIEEPFSVDTSAEKLDKSDDSLSHIAEKVMREVEAAETDDSVHHEEAALNQPEARDRRNFASGNSTVRKNSEKESVEAATIVEGAEDVVKGDFIYRDQTATVIADHDHDPGSRKESRRRNLREYLSSERPNDPVGNDILANYDRLARDRSMREKFERLDNLVRDSLRSRRRAFRSVAYDDPFHLGRDERQEKIDHEIDKEFAEITEALDEASDQRRNMDHDEVGGSRIAGIKTRSRITRARKGKGGKHKLLPSVNAGIKVKIPKRLVAPSQWSYGLEDFDGMLKNIPYDEVKKSRRNSWSRITRGRKGKGGKHKLLPSISTGIKVKIPKRLVEAPFEAIRNSSSKWTNGLGDFDAMLKNIPHDEVEDSRTKRNRTIRGRKGKGGKHKLLPSVSAGIKVKIPKKLVEEPFQEAEDSRIARRNNQNRVTRGRKGTGKGGKHKLLPSISTGIKVKIPKKLVETPFEEVEGPRNNRDRVTRGRKGKGKGGKHKLLPSVNAGIKVKLPKRLVQAVRSSTSEYDVAQTDINEIVKQIIKSDYRGGRRQYSPSEGRMEHDELREGNMQKKCQDSPVTPFFSNEERYGATSPAPSTTRREQKTTTARPTVTHTQADTETTVATQQTTIILNNEIHTVTSNTSSSTAVFDVNRRGTADQVQVEIISHGITKSMKLDEPRREAGTPTDLQYVDLERPAKLLEMDKGGNSSGKTTGRKGDDAVMPTTIYDFNNTRGQSYGLANELPTTYVYGQSFEEQNVTGIRETTEVWRSSTQEAKEIMTTVVFDKSEATSEAPQSPDRPKSIGQLLKLNDTGGSSVILVKTYSVSQNPGGFLDNYKFPVNVKKVLLKKINDTSEREEESLAQKVNRLIADQERADDPELGIPNDQNLDSKRMGKKSAVMIEQLPDTPPPDDDTTHFSWDDDVNATNFGFVIEEPILTGNYVESFYDYDPNSDSDVKRSCLKKREVKDVRRSDDIDDDSEPRCRDGGDLKWQGKMDILKLKKHQDMLKEYLNWSPDVDTTVMRIYSVSSTVGAASTTKKSSEKKGSGQEEASTMSIMLVEDEKPKQNEDAAAKGQLDDKQILEKLRKIPGDDNLMIISVTEKNRSNLTGAEVKILEPKRRSTVKRRRGRSKVRRKKRQNRNVSAGNVRKGRNSRRLMSVQLNEGKDDRRLRDEEGPEAFEIDEEARSSDSSSSFHKKEKRNEPTKPDDSPTDKGETSMEKLHVLDADKYIKMMAEKISRLGNIDGAEQDLGAERRAKVVNDSRKATAKIESSSGRGGVASLVEDDESMVDYGEEIPQETGRLVGVSHGQYPMFGKLGSDFEISISGKVHINGEQASGQPMSISIEGLSVDNVTSSGDRTHSNGLFPPFPIRPDIQFTGRSKNGSDFARKQDDRVFYDDVDLNDKRNLFREAGPRVRMSSGRSTPRKTFYNVVVRAHPRYEKWPVGDSGSDYVENLAENVEEKNPESLTEDEPVFDFAKLELRDGKRSRSDPVRRSIKSLNHRRLKERDAPGETKKLTKHRVPEKSGQPRRSDVKLVKLVPVELVESENRKEGLMDGKPNHLVALNKNLDESRLNPAPSNYISKLSEPCFSAEESTVVSIEPEGFWRNYGPKKGRLSTDDVLPPRGGDTVIKGVEISSPGESQEDVETSDCDEEDSQGSRKPVELKNLMTMMNVFENVKKPDRDPKTLVQVQSVLLLPEPDNEEENTERVVEIGEGVKHEDRNADVIVFQDGDQSPGSPASGIIPDNDKDKSLVAVSEAQSRLEDSKNYKSTDGKKKPGTEDIKRSFLKLGRKASSGERSRSKITGESRKKIESPVDSDRSLRQDRQARVSKIGAVKKLSMPSVVNGGELNHKEKRKTKDEDSEVARRHRSKRKHRKKKKKKKKKHKHKNVGEKKKKKKWWPFKRNLLAVTEDEVEDRGTKRRKKRQIKAGGTQTRGGQDCMDRRHPSRVDAARYQESAHCLRFSDLWYSVYELENPIMEHTVYLQLFEKHTLPDGTTHWDDLTQGSMVRLGSFVRHQRDGAPTISFTYSGAKTAPQKGAKNLDPVRDRLLVPSPVAQKKLAKYPEVKGGSGEYLVVQSNAINRDENECDKAGVGFATFATQPDRCGHPKETCLKNQPLAYWRHDVEARESGRPGCYFLSNFASVPKNPIKYNVSGSGSREYLGLEYHSPHVSSIDVEVRADYNAIVRVGSSGRVTEVYVDSTAAEHTVVTVVISNMGLASSPYQSRITDCPAGLPVSWSRAKGAMQVIAPQHDQRVTLDLYGQLYVDGFHCSVEVLNHRGELVAMRRIRVQKMDRCFCVWHCLCACFGSVTGLRCRAMSPEHYHAAGFQGPVPVVSVEPSVFANAIKDVVIFSALVVLLLLVSGMMKWTIGVFYPYTSRWGLDVLLEGREIRGYFEPELCCRSIVTDEDGRIVHPDTGKRTVRICSRRAEFFLNLTFFLTYPIAVCLDCVRNSLASRRNCFEDESQVCLLRDESTATSCTKLICVDTYGESRNSKMEAEDTRYVMNELKRSRDSLQDGIGKRSMVGMRLRK